MSPSRRSAAFGGIGCLLITGGVLWILFASSLLAVQHVDVSGQVRTSRADVVEASGVVLDTPLARVDVAAVRQRVRALRVVEAVRVRRKWPSTLRIVVDERVPIAAVPRDRPGGAGRGYVLLDAHGVRVATAVDTPEGLPVVRIRTRARGAGVGPAAGAGLGVQVRTSANRDALRVLNAMSERLAGKVSRITVTPPERLTLRLRGGATVVWGKPEQSNEKARILSVLLRRRDVNTYDVSSPEVVTTE